MKINGKEILERLAEANQNDRGKTTLYLSKKVYQDFKKVCEDSEVPTSQVLEELMKQFVEGVKRK